MSDLLNQASLVMIPSGYKEDTVFSQLPQDGSGDLAFTRASNGTRVNSAGLVEVCPWNLFQQSEDFSNAAWTKTNTTVTSNSITAPNGTLTADLIVPANATDGVIVQASLSFIVGTSYSLSVYGKKEDFNFLLLALPSAAFPTSNRVALFDLNNGTIASSTQSGTGAVITDVGNGWYRCSITITATATTSANVVVAARSSNNLTSLGNGTDGIYIWGAQLNIGSTAKPYFPTTDRLNVPRLTYQNGGGGCPSLLLEKQSTNLLSWSEDLTNAVYLSAAGAGGSITRTANYAISPDGTQNADRLQFVRGSSYAELYQRVATTIGVTYTFSFYAKSLSGTPTLNTAWNGTQANEVTFTTEWVRYTYTFVASSTSSGFNFITWTSLPNTSTTADILVWGAQLEASSYPTSYIPTTSSSATRVADACFKTGISSLIGQTEGFIAGEVEGLTNSYGSQSTIMSVSDGTTANRIMFSFNASTGYVTPRIFKAGSTIFVNDYAITLTQKIKFAIGWGGGRAVCYVNGTQVQETTGLTFFSSGTLTRFGADDGAGSNIGIGKVSEYILGTTNLTNAQLQSLTL